VQKVTSGMYPAVNKLMHIDVPTLGRSVLLLSALSVKTGMMRTALSVKTGMRLRWR